MAIDRTSKLAFAKLETEANRYTASDFLRELVAFVPYKIHTVLTDNGVQFCHAPRNRSGPTALYSRHMFDRVCHEHGIEHRLTKPNHPWTNGQVERMNRTIKDATVKRYHYETHEQLRAHLQLFVDAYNHARRLKTLRGLTPYEHVLQVWTKQPERFRLDPSHHIPGPYTQHCRACSLKPRCTRSQRRLLTPRSREEHDALVAARARETSSAFAVDRRRRAGIEGTLSRGVRGMGLRRSRYLGLARTHLQHLLTATAINLGRLGRLDRRHPRWPNPTLCIRSPHGSTRGRVGVRQQYRSIGLVALRHFVWVKEPEARDGV